jgi:hypothetical protein
MGAGTHRSARQNKQSTASEGWRRRAFPAVMERLAVLFMYARFIWRELYGIGVLSPFSLLTGGENGGFL